MALIERASLIWNLKKKQNSFSNKGEKKTNL